MVLHFLPNFEHPEAVLLVVTTNAGALCWFRTFVLQYPERRVAQSDILIKVVVLTLPGIFIERKYQIEFQYLIETYDCPGCNIMEKQRLFILFKHLSDP